MCVFPFGLVCQVGCGGRPGPRTRAPAHGVTALTQCAAPVHRSSRRNAVPVLRTIEERLVSLRYAPAADKVFPSEGRCGDVDGLFSGEWDFDPAPGFITPRSSPTRATALANTASKRWPTCVCRDHAFVR